MKALIYDGPNKFTLRELQKPVLGDEEVLVRVKAVGACGSDFHGFAGESGRRYPGMVMGHEIAGEIVEVGTQVNEYEIGQHVVIQPINFCGECLVCREGKTSVCLNKRMIGVNMDQTGGLAEYIPVRKNNVFPIDKDVPFEIAALAEPLSVGAGAVGRANIKNNDTIAIVGAGMIGISVLLMVKQMKPSKVFIIDKDVKKLSIAEKFGATPINFEKEDPVASIQKLTDGLGVDVAFEAVGVQSSVDTSIFATRTGGKTIWIGNMEPNVKVPMQEIVTKAKRIQGVYCYENEDFARSVSYIEKNFHELDLFVNKTVALEETQELFIKLANAKLDVFRAIIKL